MELFNLRCRVYFKLCIFCKSLYKLTEFQVVVLEKFTTFCPGNFIFQFQLADKVVLLKFLGHLWCKPPNRGEESVSALLQVQSLHIANVCLSSVSGKTVKELIKATCTGA